MTICFSYDLAKRSSSNNLFHIPSKIYNQFEDYFGYEFELNIFKDWTFIGNKKDFRTTSGPEIYLPIEFKQFFGIPLSGILTFEMVLDQKQIEIIKNDKMLNNTEREMIILSRIGQGKFRSSLIEFWKGCSITNENNLSVLVASHIKPWSVSNNVERLDVHNGLLLTPNIDKLFDKGYITFNKEDGFICLSPTLGLNTIENFHILESMRLRKLDKLTQEYLEFHNDVIFQNS